MQTNHEFQDFFNDLVEYTSSYLWAKLRLASRGEDAALLKAQQSYISEYSRLLKLQKDSLRKSFVQKYSNIDILAQKIYMQRYFDGEILNDVRQHVRTSLAQMRIFK